jgi:hypothetical protein
VRSRRRNTRFGRPPGYLEAPLRKWVQEALEGQPDLTLLHVRLEMPQARPSPAPAQAFAGCLPAERLYDAIDAILRLGGPWPLPVDKPEALVAQLKELLGDRSPYVKGDGTRLTAKGMEADEIFKNAELLLATDGPGRAAERSQRVDRPEPRRKPEQQPRLAGRSGRGITAGQVFAFIVGIATIIGAIAAVLALTSH